MSGIANIADHFVGGGVLFLDRGGDGVGDVVYLLDDVTDGADGFDRSVGVALDGGNFAADVFGGLSGLLGEFLHFVGDHGEPLARFTSASGFDGGVESEKVGLFG